MPAVDVELCVHVRLMGSFMVMGAPVDTCVRWFCMRKLNQLNVLPHAGDAIAVLGIESPRSVEYTIVRELEPSDEPDPIPTVKLQHEDFMNQKSFERRFELFQSNGWHVSSSYEEAANEEA